MSIVLSRVTKSYSPKKVVDDVSLEVENGEFFVLLGSSGSGKSTLLRLIAGLMPTDSGRIELHGKDVTHLPPQARNTGFVFQNYSLFQHMTVEQNIEFGLSIRRASRQARRQRVGELLELIGLPGHEDRMPWQLSGGEQQRVALARALAHGPEVLLLDEPFGALDAKIRTQLRQNLREIQQRLKVSTILVTHDQEEAFELADRIGIITRGKLLDTGVPSELYRNPRNRYTATFLGEANLLPGRYYQRAGQPSEIDLGYTRLPAHPCPELRTGQTVEVMLRPEEVDLARSAEQLQSEPIGSGFVKDVLFAGALQRVTIEMKHVSPAPDNGKPFNALIDASQALNRGIVPGAEVWVGYKRFHVLNAAEQ